MALRSHLVEQHLFMYLMDRTPVPESVFTHTKAEDYKEIIYRLNEEILIWKHKEKKGFRIYRKWKKLVRRRV